MLKIIAVSRFCIIDTTIAAREPQSNLSYPPWIFFDRPMIAGTIDGVLAK